MVTVYPCTNKKQLKLFEQLPERIHERDPYYVPPFPGSVSKLFSPKAPFARLGTLMPFIAEKNGKPVGRIAAIVNRVHNEYHKDTVGFFGFFDSINDKEVADALFTKVREELGSRGLTSVRGPFSPSINDECGLLVEGFEAAPFIFMAYNPPYYLDLYESVGLQKSRDLHAYYIPSYLETPERVSKIVARVRKSTGLTFRSVDMRNLKNDLRIICDIYNETLNRNWGFVPLSFNELESFANELKEFADPNMILIAEKDGKAAGFSLCLPNINEFMWKTKSSKGIIRLLKLIWHFKTKHPREARLLILGVLPEFRSRGIEAVFYHETLTRGKKYVGGELSWVDEDNAEIAKPIELMGAKRYKTYRLFESPTSGHA